MSYNQLVGVINPAQDIFQTKDNYHVDKVMCYSGYWNRNIATLLDVFIVSVAVLLLPYLFGLEKSVVNIFVFVLLYETLTVGSNMQATFGMRIMSMHAIRSDGRKVTYPVAFLRFFAQLVTLITGNIGFLMVAFTKDKKSLHDVIVDTRVIDDNPLEVRAGFWSRYVAYSIDLMFVLLITLIAAKIFGISLDADSFLLFIIVYVIYNTICTGSSLQATIGKRAMSIYVMRMDGRKMTYMHAFGRFLSSVVSMLILCFGYLMIVFTKNRASLHDVLAETRVVYGYPGNKYRQNENEYRSIFLSIIVTIVVLTIFYNQYKDKIDYKALESYSYGLFQDEEWLSDEYIKRRDFYNKILENENYIYNDSRSDKKITEYTSSGTNGNDFIKSFPSSGTFRGLDGDDIINATYGNNVLYGDGGDDVLNGYVGSDQLNGGAGNDRILGYKGNDIINGGEGADKILTGPGSDVVVYGQLSDSTRKRRDLILDFESGVDKISFTELKHKLNPEDLLIQNTNTGSIVRIKNTDFELKIKNNQKISKQDFIL